MARFFITEIHTVRYTYIVDAVDQEAAAEKFFNEVDYDDYSDKVEVIRDIESIKEVEAN